jgi:D-alanyl-lipoteichoic acid acyltransferase DltB (MBOAT superfamily)
MWAGILLVSFFLCLVRLSVSNAGFIIIPLGISYYSLQAISVLVDSNNGRFQDRCNVIELSSFLGFFAIAPAGPIHRPNDLVPQLRLLSIVPISNFVIGGKRILWGCFCKIIIADKIGFVIDPIFGEYQEQNGINLFVACCFYSFQLFFDLFGYSQIAIGLGLLFGIELKRNFDKPYSSISFREFWRRWHMSLSTWFRDYVYIPMGGSANGYVRFCFAVVVTFFVSAVWHGFELHFILWGAAVAFFYLVEDMLSRSRFSIGRTNSIFSSLKVVGFFLTITFTWTLFKFTDLPTLFIVLNKITAFHDWKLSSFLSEFKGPQIWFLLPAIFVLLFSNKINYVVQSSSLSIGTRIIESVVIVCFILYIVIYGDIGQKEFVYLNF